MMIFRSLLLGIALLATAADAQTVRLATTTSTANTGLLDYLLPKFRARTGIAVQYVAVGTGAALKIGEQGDADVVLVHDRESEDKFVAAGFGVKRRDVMYNDFVIVGAPTDRARTCGSCSSGAPPGSSRNGRAIICRSARAWGRR